MAVELVSIITPETSTFLLNPFGERRKNGRTGSECCYPLLKIPGQRYTFSSSYPLEPSQDSSEEFIFFTYPFHEENGGGVICSISVDEQGQFWIECNKINKTKNLFPFPSFLCFRGEKTCQIFVNKRKVAEKVRIEEGDSISFGRPVAFGERNNGILPEIGNYFLQLVTDFQYRYNLSRVTEFRFATDIWPVFTVRVLSKILSLLSFTDLKSCRLISKFWELEARRLLEQKGKVSLNLKGYEYTYFHPAVSLLIFRYLKESPLLHLQTLELHLPSTSGPISGNIKPSEIQRASAAIKMFDDLKNLSQRPFTTLTLYLNMESLFDFSILRHLLVELPLIELTFGGEVRIQLLREDPLPSGALRKFTHLRCDRGDSENCEFCIRNWVNFFTPFLRGLTSLSLQDERLVHPYFLVETRFGNLRELYLKNVRFSSLNFLLKLRKKLVVLEVLKPPNFYLHYTRFDDDISLLSEILQFHSETLERLKIQLSPISREEKTVLTFPKFPKLKEFLLSYYSNYLRIDFGKGKRALVLDYSEFFPVLRTLKIFPRSFELVVYGCFGDLRWEHVPFPLWKDGDLFQAFFPEGGCPVESVRKLELEDPEEDYGPFAEISVKEEDEEELDKRLKNIAEMFPNVTDWKWEEIRNGDFYRARKKKEAKELSLRMLSLIDSL